MATTVNSIVIPDEFVDVCARWYSGQGDLLYAVCSTGNLTTGTIRPLGCETDEQWYLTLWRELSCDVGRAERDARDNWDGDAEVLARFEKWVDEVCERLEVEYKLEDWEGC
jgi:hypothetical protein